MMGLNVSRDELGVYALLKPSAVSCSECLVKMELVMCCVTLVP